MEKILVFDNYDSFTYNLVHYIRSQTKKKVDVFRNDKISIDAIDEYSKILLSPGPGLPEQSGILKPLIKRYAAKKNIFGVCLGMQAIAEVFGGHLENLDTVYHGVATKIDILDDIEILFQDIPKSIEVGRYHSWIVSGDNFPKCLDITSKDKSGQIMSLRHKQYDVRGVQFHPESILTLHGKQIIKNWLDM